jgi:hypothetical protein
MLTTKSAVTCLAILCCTQVVALPRLGWAQPAAGPLVFPPSTSPRPLESTAPSTPAPQRFRPLRPRAIGEVQLRLILPQFVDSIAVYDESEKVVARCNRSCDLWLAPGDYLVHIRERTDPSSASELDIELRQPTTITMTPTDGGTATFGLVLGILGPIVAGTGMFFTFVGLFNPDLFVPGVVATVAGTGATVGGWILFARNRHPRLDEKPFATQSASSTFRVGASPLVGGAAVAATWTF